MSDIVKRLRKGDVYGDCKHDRCMCDVMHEAADEITRLRAALREIAKVTRGYEPGVWSEEEGRKYFAALFFGAQAKARAALKEDGK